MRDGILSSTRRPMSSPDFQSRRKPLVLQVEKAGWVSLSLLDVEQLDFENEFGIRGDDWWSSVNAISERSWDVQLTLTSDLHALNSDIPAADDVTIPKHEAEWSSSYGAVNLRS